MFLQKRTFTLLQPIISQIKNAIRLHHHQSSSASSSSFSTAAASDNSSSARSTIYAVATGGIRCALAVIRVSGPRSGEVVGKIGRFPSAAAAAATAAKLLPEPRQATLRKLYDPVSKKIIDHGILLWFPGPKSFTGEDSCEFHVHGGPAVVTSVLEAISAIPGCRVAEPGEFSRRAFLNGKMDLTAVEGLGDLISAETEMQRAQALNQMSGSLGSLYVSWRDRIAKCLANAEAFIDFGEDENIESDVLEKVELEIECLLKEMTNHLKDQKKGERLRNGVRIAILGRPNVGKSSLLNILSKRDAAIVSNIPGTTRDVVEACIDFKGYPVIFADTAGIRAAPDEIEKEGIRRAVQEAEKADVVLLVMSYVDISKKLGAAQQQQQQQQYSHHHHRSTCTSDGGGDNAAATVIAACTPIHATTTTAAAELDKRALIQEELAELLLKNPETDELEEFLDKVVLVANKVDLEEWSSSGTTNATEEMFRVWRRSVFDACISCKTLDGLETFTELIATKVSKLCSDPKFEAPCLTRERHRSHLQNCIESLNLYLEPQQNIPDLALRTHHLKLAVNNIGYITGHLGTEDILDIIFREFCIGK